MAAHVFQNKTKRCTVDVATSAQGAEVRLVAQGNPLEKLVAQRLGADARSGNGDVLVFGSVDGYKVSKLPNHGCEKGTSVGDDASARGRPPNQMGGSLAFEFVECGAFDVRVDLLDLAYLEGGPNRVLPDDFCKPGAGLLPCDAGAKILRVAYAGLFQQPLGNMVNRHGGKHHGADAGPSARFIDAESQPKCHVRVTTVR